MRRQIAAVALVLGCAACASTHTRWSPSPSPAPVTERPAPPAPPAPQAPLAPGPFRFEARRQDGRPAGELLLGGTTFDAARKLLAPESGDGAPRTPEGFPQVKFGSVSPAPTTVYAAANTSYELFFDVNRRLVMVQDHQPPLSGLTLAELQQKYPQLRETDRDADAVELQGEIAPCVTMLVLVGEPEGKVEDVAHAYTCRTKP
jgi:hypothetical protein